jgi:hypothetical protein
MTLNLSTLYGNVGPANSDIANAVAAPSASTIATAVAGAVPTISAINTSVSTYASGFGNTYTLLGSAAYSAASAYTVSWSGTYKKIVVMGLSYSDNNAEYMKIRFNGDSSSNYASGAGNNTTGGHSFSDTSAYVVSSATAGGFTVVVENANTTTAPKYFNSVGYSAGVTTSTFGTGHYTGSSAITSVTMLGSAGGGISTNSLGNYNGLYVFGVN